MPDMILRKPCDEEPKDKANGDGRFEEEESENQQVLNGYIAGRMGPVPIVEGEVMKNTDILPNAQTGKSTHA